MSCTHLTAPQGTPEWFQGRCGVITASMFSECRKRLKSGPNKGDFSKAAHDYAFKLAVERISGELLDDPQFDPWQAKRGRELEPEARLKYEEKESVLVQETGLAIAENKLFGASVDGLVDDEGNVEIKCFLAPSKLAPILLTGDIGDCEDQIQGGMWITEREWTDFILYCPALAKVEKDLTVIRIHRDEKYIAELEQDLQAFNILVETYKYKLEKEVA
jgi:hypothetical protein